MYHRLVIELKDIDPNAAKLLVRDALVDFMIRRKGVLEFKDDYDDINNAASYVARRYSHMDASFQIKKVKEVTERYKICRRLRLLVDVENP